MYQIHFNNHMENLVISVSLLVFDLGSEELISINFKCSTSFAAQMMIHGLRIVAKKLSML